MVSNSQVDRLGRALRDGSMTQDDVALLAEMRQGWERGLTSLVAALELEFVGDPIQVSSRQKNLGTLREKLFRLSGGLSSIRDIMGCRLVVEGTRSDQSQVVQRLLVLFQSNQPRIISRLTDPRAGYRAVHVEIRLEYGRAEIQVRTRAQHEWADAMERFGDRVGRGIRYEDDSFAHLPSIVGARARECLVALKQWSEDLDLWERSGSPPGGDVLEKMNKSRQRAKLLLEKFDESL